MSKSTEELKAAVEGASEVLTEAGNVAEQLSAQTSELADEAAGHGWYGIAARMQDVAEALEAAAAQVSTGREACESALQEMGLINDRIPAEEVTAHLGTSTSRLREAEIVLEGAVEKVDEAQTAAAEIGQESLMQATLDLCDRLTEIRQQIGQYRSTSAEERASADDYAKRQLGNSHRVGVHETRHHPEQVRHLAARRQEKQSAGLAA